LIILSIFLNGNSRSNHMVPTFRQDSDARLQMEKKCNWTE
jgi:hypothetical protein